MSTTTIQLTEKQHAAIGTAHDRADGALSLESIANGRGAQILGAHLIEKGLVREVRAKAGMPVWRHDDAGVYFALVLTKAGRGVIAICSDARRDLASSASRPDGVLIKLAPDEHVTGDLDAAIPTGSKGQAADGAVVNPAPPRTRSKLAGVVDLLRRESGVSLEELVTTTGWLPHTTRAALTGLRRRGYAIERQRVETGSIYRITGSAAADAA